MNTYLHTYVGNLGRYVSQYGYVYPCMSIAIFNCQLFDTLGTPYYQSRYGTFPYLGKQPSDRESLIMTSRVKVG